MELTLQATLRSSFGSPQARRERAKGFLPAVIYGAGIPSEHALLSLEDFKRTLHHAGETSFITLTFLNARSRRVLIREIDWDPVKRTPRHVDFYEPKAGEKLRAKVPLVFVGSSPLLEHESGVLVKTLHELEVETLPENLPHEISVDISRLQNFGEHILVRDILLPSGVEPKEASDLIVASIVPAEKEVEAAPVAAEEAVAEVKVEAEEKREKREAESKAEGEPSS